MGKMKFGVSKLLQNSLSKWLSPKVEVGTGRRRRHEEIDSDDEPINQNTSPATTVALDSRYQQTPQLAAPPPNKKKKTFTVRIVNDTHFDLVFFYLFSMSNESHNHIRLLFIFRFCLRAGIYEPKRVRFVFNHNEQPINW